MNARTTEIRHHFSPKNHVPPKYKVAYDGKHKRQYSKSHTARFKMKTVLLFQSLSKPNLRKIRKSLLLYNLITMMGLKFITDSIFQRSQPTFSFWLQKELPKELEHSQLFQQVKQRLPIYLKHFGLNSVYQCHEYSPN